MNLKKTIKCLFKEEMNIAFKGERNYLRGIDIVNEVIKKIQTQFDISSMKNIDFSFHSMANTQLKMYTYDAKYVDSADYSDNKSVLKFTSSGIKLICIIKALNSPVKRRGTFNEEEIFDATYFTDENSVALNQKPHFSLLEILDTMNKYLLIHKFSEINRKWVFARILLDRFPNDPYSNLSVKFKNIFSDRYAKSLLLINGSEIGSIYCSTL